MIRILNRCKSSGDKLTSRKCLSSYNVKYLKRTRTNGTVMTHNLPLINPFPLIHRQCQWQQSRPLVSMQPKCVEKDDSESRTRLDPMDLKLDSEKIASLCYSSVLGNVGETVVLTTIAKEVEMGEGTTFGADAPSTNLTVDYKQRYHGIGRIPTVASRRDNAAPTVSETLGSRAIDRAIRPLIKKLDDNGMHQENVHVNCSVQSCSFTNGCNPIVLSINTASAALGPLLEEPVAAISIGLVADKRKEDGVDIRNSIIVNPNYNQDQIEKMEECSCQLLYAGTRNHAIMAEFHYYKNDHGSSIPEKTLTELIKIAHDAIQPLLDAQDQYQMKQQQQMENANVMDVNMTNKEIEPCPDDEENTIRKSLGLAPIPKEESQQHDGALQVQKRNDHGKQSINGIIKKYDLINEATKYCKDQLGNSIFHLFGYQVSNVQQSQEKKQYDNSFVHSHGDLLSKKTRGRRERIIYKEIQRLIHKYTGTNKIAEIIKEELNETMCRISDGTNDTIQKQMDEKIITIIYDKILREAFCSTAILHGTRADERCNISLGDINYGDGFKTIRPISVTLPVLPDVVHGSALFSRGETQVLCTVTLGPPDDGIQRSHDPYSDKNVLQKTKGDEDANGSQMPYSDLPVGSVRYLRTQEALISDMNTRKIKAERERLGDTKGGTLYEKYNAFLQYDFPAFSTGELPKGGGARHNRRAIGHGNLAEKSILPVLPSPDLFPYAIRLTSEVTSSNGSSSMASVCGVTLALLDAGVPIIEPVAGVSVGLAFLEGDNDGDGKERHDKYRLLLDITGTEDHYGAMDFKVAGTSHGVTAFQLDVKKPLPLDILCEALIFAKSGRYSILKEMKKQAQPTLQNKTEKTEKTSKKNVDKLYIHPRPKLKDTTPLIEIIKYNPERKRDLIGPSGAILRQLEDRYEGIQLDLTQDGQCILYGYDHKMVKKAKSTILDLVSDIMEGETYEGTVVEIKDFGAIVELLRNKEGLLHVSELLSLDEEKKYNSFTSSPGKDRGNSHTENGTSMTGYESLAVGQKIKVLCTGVDPVQGHIRLSRKLLLAEFK